MSEYERPWESLLQQKIGQIAEYQKACGNMSEADTKERRSISGDYQQISKNAEEYLGLVKPIRRYWTVRVSSQTGSVYWRES